MFQDCIRCILVLRICVGINRSLTRGRSEHSLYIAEYSKCMLKSNCILSALQIYDPIFVMGLNAASVVKHRGAFKVDKYRMTFGNIF